MGQIFADDEARVRVRAWDRAWLTDAHVTTDFYHLLADEDLAGIWATAEYDHSTCTRVPVK